MHITKHFSFQAKPNQHILIVAYTIKAVSRHSTHSGIVKFIFLSRCMSGGSEVNSSTNSSVYYSYMSN